MKEILHDLSLQKSNLRAHYLSNHLKAILVARVHWNTKLNYWIGIGKKKDGHLTSVAIKLPLNISPVSEALPYQCLNIQRQGIKVFNPFPELAEGIFDHNVIKVG